MALCLLFFNHQILILGPWLSNLAAYWNHMKNFKKYLCLGPILREHELVWAAAWALGIYKASQMILKCSQGRQPLIERSHVAAEP